MDKFDLSEKVGTVLMKVMMAAWALAIFCLILHVNDNANVALALVATLVLFLLSFPVWLFVFPLIAAPVAFAITAFISRSRA